MSRELALNTNAPKISYNIVSREAIMNAFHRVAFQLLMALGITALGDAAFAQPLRPNIVFILMDDLRFDELGCVGHPFAKTPNIDRLAKEGAIFKNAFATTPLCSPSRACFMTGALRSHQRNL